MAEERVDKPDDLNNSFDLGRKRKRQDNLDDEAEINDEDETVTDQLKNRGVLRKMHKAQDKSPSESTSKSPS